MAGFLRSVGLNAAAGAADVLSREPAGMLAAAALFGAEPAMLVSVGVALAFLCARAARELADFESAQQHFLVRPCPSRRQPCGGFAQIGAIEIEADALTQLGDVGLRQTGVRASRARLRARETFVDAPNQQRAEISFHFGMRAGHPLGIHDDAPAACLHCQRRADFIVPALRAL
jgi:hypothetical protein